VKKIGEGEPNLLNLIESGKISLIINTPTKEDSLKGMDLK